MLEQRVVIDPDDADREEAHEVSGIRGPEMQERATQIGRLSRHAQLEHEQRSRDREDAVTECFEPTRPHRAQFDRGPSGRRSLRTPGSG